MLGMEGVSQLLGHTFYFDNFLYCIKYVSKMYVIMQQKKGLKTKYAFYEKLLFCINSIESRFDVEQAKFVRIQSALCVAGTYVLVSNLALHFPLIMLLSCLFAAGNDQLSSKKWLGKQDKEEINMKTKN